MLSIAGLLLVGQRQKNQITELSTTQIAPGEL
jgi:hypothetical protein